MNEKQLEKMDQIMADWKEFKNKSNTTWFGGVNLDHPDLAEYNKIEGKQK